MSHDPHTTDEKSDRSRPGRDVSPPEERRGLELSVPQLLAGALAAASAAVAASWLGVAGTVTGAIVASLVASVSTALYKHPLEKSSEALRENLPAIAVLPQSRLGSTQQRAQHLSPHDEAESRQPHSTQPYTTEPHRTQPLSTQPQAGGSTRAAEDAAGPAVQARPRPKPQRRVRWGAVAASAAIMLVLGFAILTGLEGILGKSFAALMGNDGNNAPTISRFVNGNDNDKDPGKGSDKPTTKPPSTNATTDTPTTEAPTTSAPTTDAPTTDAPTDDPSEEAPTTEAPTTGAAPTTDAPAGDSPDPDAPTTNAPANDTPTTGVDASDQDAGSPITG